VVLREREARLVLIGGGPERDRLRHLAEEVGVANHVDLLAFDPNPFRYMARASVFALTSRWEGLPGALIQALACGAPVVATDCPSGPREILDGGRYGALIPVGDVDRLAEALVGAIEGRTSPAPARAWARFETSAAVDAYEDAIREVIEADRTVTVSAGAQVR